MNLVFIIRINAKVLNMLCYLLLDLDKKKKLIFNKRNALISTIIQTFQNVVKTNDK